MEEDPLISHIHHFALDDGPGIRSTVFFKGCPLSCAWCHNPEAMSSGPEIGFYPDLCIGCGDCLKACPEGAISMEPAGRVIRELCRGCGVCANTCPATALKMIGRYYAVPELTEILLRDRIFYKTSGGGVTFSGGEPTLHMDYLAELSRELKREGIHIAIQTSGLFDPARFANLLLPFIDLIYFDIKIMDPKKHEYWTGSENGRILTNFLDLANRPDVQLVARIPLIPGITATDKNLAEAAAFLRRAGCEQYELLSYNGAGLMKRDAIGKARPEPLAGVRWDGEADAGYRSAFARYFAGGFAASHRE